MHAIGVQADIEWGNTHDLKSAIPGACTAAQCRGGCGVPGQQWRLQEEDHAIF